MSRRQVNPWICTMSSAQSRDDLAISLTPKKNKKDKGLFTLFRSTSDPDLTADIKNGTLWGKKRKDKCLPSKEVNGNGVHHGIPEEVIKEKGETEETKEKRKERREKGEERVGKKEKTSKKDREEEKPTKERKEKRRESEKDKKLSRRDEMEGSEADCSICQERIRKSKEKSQNKESRHKDKEHRSKYEHRRTRDYHEEDGKERGHKNADKYDDEKEYSRKKKHYHDKEKEREREKPKRDKHRHHHHHHRRKSDEYEVDSGPFPCNTANCMTCKESLNRLEAWQERCTAEIESTRRRLEHRLHRLEKKLEEQQSEERQMKDFEYDRVLGRVTDECREVSKSVKNTSGDVKDEIRGLIKGGLSKLELKLGQISTGYNIPFMGFQDRCNPELGRNCSADRGIRRAVRSRSSPHLGRAPCEDCASALDHGAVPTPLNVSASLTSPTNSAVSSRVGSRASSRASSRGNLSDTGSMETVIEARPVHEEDVLKAVPETILEAKPVMEECAHNLNETYAASQVHHQRQVQQVEKWWRNKAEEEQRVLYARICELEQMLMNTEMGDGSSGGGSTLYIV